MKLTTIVRKVSNHGQEEEGEGNTNKPEPCCAACADMTGTVLATEFFLTFARTRENNVDICDIN